MNIPKGYKLVPVDPTVAMEEAAVPECGGYCPRCDDDVQIKTGMQVDIYRTMLAAAPTPPQPIYDEAKERDLFEAAAVKSAQDRDLEADDMLRTENGDYQNQNIQLAFWGWLACAQSRAKAGEVDHE